MYCTLSTASPELSISGTRRASGLPYFSLFITAYKAVNIQGLYTVYNSTGVQATVSVLELAGDQGRRQPLR
jgi:hypothetical protein